MHHIELSRYVGHRRHTAVSHCQTCNPGDSHPLVLSLYWAQPGKEEGGREREGERGERGREEKGGERRKERREGKRREVAKWRNEGGKELSRMEKEEEENEMDTFVPCVCVVINVHYVLAHPAPFSHLTSLWSSENSAVMSVVSLMNITSCSPSSCFREGTS